MRHCDDLESDLMRSATIDNQCSTSTFDLLCFSVANSVFGEYAGNQLMKQLRRLLCIHIFPGTEAYKQPQSRQPEGSIRCVLC